MREGAGRVQTRPLASCPADASPAPLRVPRDSAAVWVETAFRPLAPPAREFDTSGMTLPEEAEQRLSLTVEAVLKRFGAMVRQVGRRYRLDEADVDEVMQEVRIRLWRAQRTSEQIGEVSTSYVYRTASSAALDVIRKRRSRRAEHHRSLDDGAAVVIAEPAPDPHGALEGSEAGAAGGPCAGHDPRLPPSRGQDVSDRSSP